MKIAAYAINGSRALGIVRDDTIVPLSHMLTAPPTDMKVLIDGWDELKGIIEGALGDKLGLKLTSVHLLPPVTRPEKILAIGLNYADHIAESGIPAPTQQVWFAKHDNCIVGPHDAILLPKSSSQVDYEAELVAVIGKPAKNVSRDEARNYVFGFCVGNDVSVRDWQHETTQWTLGKSFDTHGPIGPWITTADEIGDPHRLGIRSRINGELRQDSNTEHLIFDLWDQISHLSKALTLQPGDLLFTGTPGGVGVSMKPPSYLKAGDQVRIEIDELGSLDNYAQLEI